MRRGVGIVGALVLLVATACAPQLEPRVITVLASWTGAEQEAFLQVIDEFMDDHPGVTVRYEGTRALEQVLLADIQKGTPPDVAVLPSPDQAAHHLGEGRVQEEVRGLPAQSGRRWQQLQSLGRDEPVAAIVKTDLKSLVWHRGPHQEPDPVWAEPATAPGPWCLGMSAPPVSGWPGTDWIEDIFLQQQGVAAYTKWVRGDVAWNSEQMEQAWRTWGTAIADAVARGSTPASILMTDFAAAAGSMPHHCAQDHGASFGLAGFSPDAAADLEVEPFPRFSPQRQPQIITADLAVLIKPGDGESEPKTEAEEFLRFLASRPVEELWSSDETIRQHPAGAWITARLRSQDEFCLDASDLMPSALRDAFYRGALEFVSDQSRLQEILDQLDKIAEVGDTPWQADFTCAGGPPG